MKATINITSEDIKKALVISIADHLGITVDDCDLLIEVKSRQNYKSEWEQADFRGTLTITK